MIGDLSTASDRQLEVWAFGRQGVVTDRELAETALLELARRAEVARADAARTAAVQPVVDENPRGAASAGSTDRPDGSDDESEHPESTASIASRLRERRMRLTGIAGVIAAVLGLGVVATGLSTPDPDPLALFDRPETQADRDWEVRLTQDYIVAITLGPRTIELEDGVVAVAFRAAAVADGRSTEYDPYCLFTSEESADSAPISLGGTCVLPERFEAEGIVLPFRASPTGSGLDTVVWGPTGAPRFESGGTFETVGGITSALDWMVFPAYVDEGVDPTASVQAADQLLLGPTIVPMNVESDEVADLVTTAYLLRGETEEAGPVFCASTLAPDAGETTTCAPLSVVRRQGLEFAITSAGREWNVRIGADGDGRSDRIVAID